LKLAHFITANGMTAAQVAYASGTKPFPVGT